MKRQLQSIVALLALSLLLSASDQGENKSEKPPERKITLAVPPPKIISEDKADSSLGPVLAAFLMNEMGKSTVFKVIDLEMSDEVEKLLAFANSDKCDQTQCHIPVGNIIPAQKLLAGTVARLGDTYVMNVRLIDIEKNVVDFSAQERITGKKDDLEQLTQLVAIDVREHFGEKAERPHASAQPQLSPTSSPSQPSADAYLDSHNILGIAVEDLSASENRYYMGGVKVKSLSPDSPCQDILKPGNIITYMNPDGKIPGGRMLDQPFQCSDINYFRKQVARIAPGASVGFKIFPGQSTMQLGHNAVCVIPSQPQITPQTSAPPPAPAPEKKAKKTKE